MAGQCPKWESQLWSYVSTGDGMHCPLISQCRAKQSGTWCPDDDSEKLRQLIGSDGQFTTANYEFREPRGGVIFPAVEKLAQKHLERGRVSCLPVPIELISVADENNSVEVRVVHLKACHAAIWRLKGVWVIQLADNRTSSRNRFTLFHEAFHILAHSRSSTTPVFMKRGATQGSFNELLADYFAMCILMPKEWVIERWAEVKDLDRMVEIFDVPKSTMWLRLRELSLV
jgi:hypothetical protein